MRRLFSSGSVTKFVNAKVREFRKVVQKLLGPKTPRRIQMAMGQNQWYHIGIGAPPILVYFGGDVDVHWGYGVLTHHGQMTLVIHVESLFHTMPCCELLLSPPHGPMGQTNAFARLVASRARSSGLRTHS